MEIPEVYKTLMSSNQGIKEFDNLDEALKQGYRIYSRDKDLNMWLLRMYINDRWAFAYCVEKKVEL
jgi:hypothetical protein